MNFNVDDIRALAAREGVLNFQELAKNRREKGFQHFIPDLAKQGKFNGAGWSVTNGLLTVQTQHNTDELMTFLEDKLRHHAWFQTRAQLAEMRAAGKVIEQPVLPAGFDAYTEVFKSLGYWGKNPAMDVVSLLKNADSSLSVQVIVRPHDKKYAFVGGMIDKDYNAQKEAVLEKCYQETLEEWYSNDLFAQGSATIRAANAMQPAQTLEGLRKVLAAPEFSKLDPIKNDLLKIFEQPNVNFNSKMTALEQQLQTLGKAQKIPAEDLDVFWVRMKCKMYQELFPAEYRSLTDFLKTNLVVMPETTNESDPRNTQSGFMTTIPHYFYLDKDELKNKEKEWKVVAKGGDDALTAKVVDLDKLYEKSMFSAHGRILLEAVADLADNHPEILADKNFQAQLNKVQANIEKREATELGLVVNNTSGLVLQNKYSAQKPQSGSASGASSSSSSAQAPKAVEQLPVISGPADLLQLNNARPNEEPMEMVVSSQAAGKKLKAKLGDTRYARTLDILEDLRLPVSSLTVLEELSGHARVNILLDNSGSMGEPYHTADGKSTSRWKEAESRFTKLLPLLALSGVQVNLRVLNPSGSMPANGVKTFNFSRGIGTQDSVNVLEQELGQAMQFITALFGQGPNGGTTVNPPLSGFFAQAQQGETQLTLFITDGDASDQDNALRTLQSRNVEANPVTVVACTNQSHEIAWIRNLAAKKGSGVVMLNDFFAEQSHIERLHGPSVPYSHSTWLLLHVTPSVVGNQPAEGLHVYHEMDKPLSKDQLSEVLGYEIHDVYYEHYINTCPLYIKQQQAATGQPTVNFVSPPAYQASNNNNAPSAPPSNGGSSIWDMFKRN
jgi:hypothetical protein